MISVAGLTIAANRGRSIQGLLVWSLLSTVSSTTRESFVLRNVMSHAAFFPIIVSTNIAWNMPHN